jgi:nucleoside-diphosphate-sugar epimerase
MPSKNRTVLITGADGFIGSHLTEPLVKEGVKVKALYWLILSIPGDGSEIPDIGSFQFIIDFKFFFGYFRLRNIIL